MDKMSKESDIVEPNRYTWWWYVEFVFSVIIPGIFAVLITAGCIIITKPVDYWTATKDALHNPYAGLEILVALLGGMIFFAKDQLKKWNILSKKFDNYWEKHLKQDRDQLKEIFGNAQIVLKIDIEEFNSDHIRVIQDILEGLHNNKNVKAIYAIDASHPAQWWTNSMLGYLAIQSRWTSLSKDRKVHRFFILNRGELSSLSGKKIIQMHTLLGFETYIILEPIFDRLFKRFLEENHFNIQKKECLIWENPLSNPSRTSLPQKFVDDDIYGYQSFWLTDTAYGKRMTEKQLDINGNEVDISKYEIKFEFITKKHKDRAEAYYKFVLFLINAASLCTDGDDVVNKSDEINLIIHIPPVRKLVSVGTFRSVDIEIVSEIIDKYYDNTERGV